MTPTPPDTTSLYRSLDGHRRAMALYDRMLAQIEPPASTAFVDTSAGATHVVLAGPEGAAPVFLLHGMSASAVTWAPQISALARELRVIAPDMPGCMGRSAPTRVRREGTAYGVWLRDVMGALGVRRAALVGISFGGWLALKLAAVAPERIACAALMSAAGFVPQGTRALWRMIPRLAMMPFVPRERQARMFLEVMGTPGYEPSPEDIEMFGLLLSSFRYDRTAPGPCTDDEVRALSAPTMLLYGEHEAAFDSARAMRRARQLLPNLERCEVLPGVGHGMTGEDIPLVNGLLLEFLRRHAPRAAG